MAFKKAEATRRWARIYFYGGSGSGKTRTALLMAQEFSDRLKTAGKPHRIALIDTEHHRSESEVLIGFDFDVAHCESFSTLDNEVHGFDPTQYGVLVIDSHSPAWSSIQDAKEIVKTSLGTTRFDQWRKIKSPWREHVADLDSVAAHVLTTARQGMDYQEVTDSDGSKSLNAVGYKANVEKDTPYEMGMLIRMEAVKQQMGEDEFGVRKAWVEKCNVPGLIGDVKRFRKLATLADDQKAVAEAFAPLFEWFTGGEDAGGYSPTASMQTDAERLLERDEQRETTTHESAELVTQYAAQMQLTQAMAGLETIWKTIQADSPHKKSGPKRLTVADYKDLGKIKDSRKSELNGAKK